MTRVLDPPNESAQRSLGLVQHDEDFGGEHGANATTAGEKRNTDPNP